MRTRLKDVAALAGVSEKTVSNVVNGYPYIRETTRRRVQEALEQLNYRPNLSARTLVRGTSGLITLALPELDNPYFAELAKQVMRAAERYEWTVLIDQTEGLREREQAVLDGLRPRLIDGVIISPLAFTGEDLGGRRDDTPLVLLGEKIFDGPADHVATDNVGAARTATEHLLGLGRRRIAAIGLFGRLHPGTASLRESGYRQALTDAGLEPDPALIPQLSGYRRAVGAEAMAQLLDRGDAPDAVVCFNDILAIGAMRTLTERGVRIPDDVAVVGFDDVEEARFSNPSLTTVSWDKAQIAQLATDLLHDRITAAAAPPPRELRAQYTLVVRESTGGLARG